jgi:hypothetical protein
MNQWVDQIYQWTLHNPKETVVLGLVASIVALLGVVDVFWKSICSFISFCWSWLQRLAQPRFVLPSIHLDFVQIPSECRYTILSYENRILTQVNTYWQVTNSSRTNTPARLLTAEMLSPRVNDDPTARCLLLIIGPELRGRQSYGTDHEIPSGETDLARIPR